EGKTNKEVRDVGGGLVFSIANWPTPDGGWVSTHDDITDQRLEQVERGRLNDQEQRRVTLDFAIAQFRIRIEKMLATLADSGASRRSPARTLFAAADQAAQQADGAVQASNDASAGVEVAATAAEQLSSSITEISRKLTQTNDLVGLAVGEAN